MVCSWLSARPEVLRVNAMPSGDCSLEETIICKETTRFLLGQDREEKA